MLNFDKLFKLYLFKDKKTVSWSIRVADNYVQTYSIPQDKFALLITNWQLPSGYSLPLNGWSIFVMHKSMGPRPEQLPADYVQLTIWSPTVQQQFRVDASDMHELVSTYNTQLNNKMYWDI
jgi:hypothetical protein